MNENNNFYLYYQIPAELDMYNAESQKKILQELIQQNNKPIILDFAQLSYLDSSGLGVLIHFHSLMKKNKQLYCFIKIAENIFRLISLTGVEGLLVIEDNLEDAILYLKRNMQ